LRRLRTDHLDLWQIHETIYENDPDLHFAAGGVVEALDQAKREHDYPFDSCQLPLNVMDSTFRSFEREVLPKLVARGIAPIGMKSFGGGYVVRGGVPPPEALRYALSLPVATTVSGIDGVDVLRQNLAIARGFRPMSEAEMQASRERWSRFAADGRFELYKTSLRFDGAVGRKVHGFPTAQELAG
ncbi:MAG: aldo/keto reductase, partial [Thermodesulfobacteriota bacterium]